MKTFEGEIDVFHASAGTGKTKTLMDIIAKHVAEGVPLDRIAFVTFTKKGAEVAQSRITQKFGIPLSRAPHFRTIHSMCFRGCKASKDMMMDAKKYKEFGDKAGFQLDHATESVTEGIDWSEIQDRNLVNIEQLYRNNKEMYERLTADKFDHGRLVDYMYRYKKYKETFKFMDFTDLLEKYLKDGTVEDIDIACLDEMQDSTPLQWQVLFQAFSNAKHIYVAGDSKQALYSFTGASVTTLLNLRGNQHVLDISYRVPSNILTFANDIASQIQEDNHSPCKSSKEGGKVKYLTGVNEITDEFSLNKTYYMLARNRSMRKYFVEWCIDNGINYIIDNKPALSQTDWIEYVQKKFDTWTPQKIDFAQRCHEHKCFPDPPKVTISTIHGVKGGEAQRVILMSDISRLVSQGFEEEPDNEHRVFYVATTRALETLYIIEPRTKNYYPYLF